MSILKVARIAHPVLRTPAQPVPKSAFKDPFFQKLVDDMRETMYEYEGVGLAAPQVHEGLQLAVIEVGGDDERSVAEVPFMVLVNPVVTPIGDETLRSYEGCLSIPDLRGVVRASRSSSSRRRTATARPTRSRPRTSSPA
jgi:peptide deformylase